jgi:hypothetical protein
LERRHLGRSDQFTASLHRFLKQMRVERSTINLKTCEARSVTRTQLHTIIKRLLRMLRKPQAQSLFRQMMVSEMMGQSEDPCHVATTDLGGRFAHLAIELGRLLDDQDPGVRTATFEHDRCRGAGKRAADDRYIVIHGEENDAGECCERQFPAGLTTHPVIPSEVEGSR